MNVDRLIERLNHRIRVDEPHDAIPVYSDKKYRELCIRLRDILIAKRGG